MALTDYVIMPGADYQALVDKIKEKTGKTDKLKSGQLAAELDNITGGGSADVRYVTFMSHDGTKEEGKKAVATGDDCVDPFLKGIYPDVPARESTAQYDFTWIGWATEPNGPLDENALKNVTEDRVVYAVYASVLRYYTITYYDEDGTTVLKTESLAYGATPAYTPDKSGFGFEGWTPALTTVVGDANYTANWVTAITFANASWEDIVRIAESGEAQNYFALGDTKTLSFTAPDGSTMSKTIQIVGFDMDPLADGTGYANMSILTIEPTFKQAHASTTTTYDWLQSLIRESLNGVVFSSFPEALQRGVKEVSKVSRVYVDGTDFTGLRTTTDKVWLPSAIEAGFYTGDISGYGYYPEKAGEEGVFKYPGLTRYASQIIGDVHNENTNGTHMLASRSGGATYATRYLRYGYAGTGIRAEGTVTSGEGYVIFGFCI